MFDRTMSSTPIIPAIEPIMPATIVITMDSPIIMSKILLSDHPTALSTPSSLVRS